MSKLDREEKDILGAFDSGKLKRVRGVKKEIERHKSYAEATFKKDARINIRYDFHRRTLGHYKLVLFKKAFRIKLWLRVFYTSTSTVS